ncbi:Toluene-4-sulfonate monooxygenase system iron-sulfur subunit TsaM1 [Zhongshania aliphaticivorans]|uniref:Toluene-4-sulfonate monooxygenase system iron-sulfur subunit TsaM1 n=1 Tax=Zhongshania aliphaticivorans TaxID=1470434 RepID=A0A5S9NRC3_9GAMM|nr:aromatic ring-hydroxylating dioxygenase subunit alpha [Zhongshania aliphaticivorans]CAA0093034.1 Toluene-4-sulfonate monooxygenase system iron-sulfur subunit TsaM1 [Zhongshania aliphaticivorans]CAA0110765.1 Toluene-4-sulfonate monooxygenase system iron-sulfur subunit TsaM1 [Zhongshania aliphaticivorans]
MTDVISAIRDTQTYIGIPLLHEHWYVAGLCEEFGRDLTSRTLLEKSVVFYRTEAGELIALQNRCLHRSFPLSESKLQGDNIVCGYHGIEYSPEGEIQNVPCQTQCPSGKLRKYPIKEVGPFVFIWMGNPENAEQGYIPELPYLENPQKVSFYGEEFLVDGSYLLLQENLNDLTHFTHLHANTFGATVDSLDESFIKLPLDFAETNGIPGCYRTDDNSDRIKLGLPPEVLAEIGDRKVVNRNGGITVSPGVWLGENFFHVEDPAPGKPETYKIYINHYLTPKTHNSCHYWYSVTTDFIEPTPENSAGMSALFRAAFEEDVVAINHMQKLLEEDTTDYKEINVFGDKAGVLIRRKMLEWVANEYPAN